MDATPLSVVDGSVFNLSRCFPGLKICCKFGIFVKLFFFIFYLGFELSYDLSSNSIDSGYLLNELLLQLWTILFEKIPEIVFVIFLGF